MMKPYPEYKDSGLPWLGEVPAHWDVRRNGRLFAQRNQTGYGDLPILEVSLKTGVRVRDMDNLKRKQVMSDREKYKRAVKSDIAYNMMRMWQGAVGVAPEDGLVSPAYVVARPYPEAEPRYFSYLFRTDAYKNEVDGFSRGIVKDRNRLYWEDFKRMPSCFPSPEEQKAIADYLDANAIKVRRFIRNRRRLIEVLNEQKQAIINRAVTRGLDPNAPLKPSGLPWCPKVPSHWELKPNRTFLKQRKVLVGERHTDFTLLSLTKRGVIIRDLTENKGKFSADMGTSQEVRRGDLVMCLFDVPETPRTVGLSDHHGMITGAYTVFETRDPFTARWLEMFYIAMDDRKLLSPLYSGLRNTIPKPIFLGIKTPMPPPDEQREIIAGVRSQTAALTQWIERSQSEIDLIREYRTRMIADVVTGKVDVRGLAPAEPTLDNEQIDEGIDDEEMLGDDEPELVEEAVDVDS